MNVEERVEVQTVTTEQGTQPERHPSEAQQAAVVEAAYILEALRK